MGKSDQRHHRSQHRRPENRLVVGVDYSRLDFVRNRGFPDGDSVALATRDPSGTFGERVRRRSPTTWTNAALFFEDALDVTDKAKLVLGGRYEYLDLDRKNFGPDGSFRRRRVSPEPIAPPMDASVWSMRSLRALRRTRRTPRRPTRPAPISSSSMRGRILR